KPDTAIAGATARAISVTVFDSTGRPAAGELVRFGVSFGAVPALAQADLNGLVTTVWTPPDSAASYTLTGIRGSLFGLNTVSDSAGRIVIRRSVLILPDVPSATRSTVAMSATSIAVNGNATVTVTVKDRFGNVVKTAAPGDFALSASAGSFSAVTCTLGVC